MPNPSSPPLQVACISGAKKSNSSVHLSGSWFQVAELYTEAYSSALDVRVSLPPPGGVAVQLMNVNAMKTASTEIARVENSR